MSTSTLGDKVVRKLVNWQVCSFERGARSFFQELMSRWPAEGPCTLAEKIQHRMIFDRRSIFRVFADKIAVRDYVRRIVPWLRLPLLLLVCESAEELRKRFPGNQAALVMKASHGSGMVRLPFQGSRGNREELAEQARVWLKEDYALRHWEWQYHRLRRRIMIEEYLGEGTDVPADYKFYMFDGEPGFITVDRGRFREHSRDLFWPNWTPIRARMGLQPNSSDPPPRPSTLTEMIDAARRLSAGLDFIRVDLYDVSGSVVFGELTCTPFAGQENVDHRALSVQLASAWKVAPAPSGGPKGLSRWRDLV